MNKPINKEVLDIRFDSDAGENLSIRQYFEQLLQTLWAEGEGFSGKRPFGNSGWQYELAKPLIENGYVDGRFDGPYIDYIDCTHLSVVVAELISLAFQP